MESWKRCHDGYNPVDFLVMDGVMSPSIQEVKAQHEDRLLAMPGVVSVGIGQDSDGKSVIIIGLDGPRPQTAEQLPKELEGYPVRMEIIGPVRAL